MVPASTATKNRLMVRKKSGRLEPFDSRKMARATSRAGVPFSIAREIAKAVKNEKSLAGKDHVSSAKLRSMVAQELRKRNQGAAAKSYLGYKKTKSTRQKYERSRKGKSKVRGKTVRTHAKQFARTRDSTRGRPPRW